MPTIPVDTAIPVLPSRDFARTIAFYGRCGFALASRYEKYLILRRDGIELHFFAFPELEPAKNIAGCYLRVSDLAPWREAFEAAGLPREGWPRLTDAADTSYGLREFAVLDEDNNLVKCGAPLAP